MRGTHAIRRQVLEVELSGSEADGLAFQQRLPDLFRDALCPALERVFDRLVPAEEHWFVDRLEIDAGTFRPQELDGAFVDAVTRWLERHLRETPRVASPAVARPTSLRRAEPPPVDTSSALGTMRRRTPVQTVQDAFIYFLRTGVLPWWFHPPRGLTLEDVVRDAWRANDGSGAGPEQFARALTRVWRQLSARKRLVRQFSADFLHALLAAVSPESASIVSEVLAAAREPGTSAAALAVFAEHLWEVAFATTIAGTGPQSGVLIAEALRAASAAREPPPAGLLERVALRWPAAKDRESSDERRPTPTHAARTQKPSERREDSDEPDSGPTVEEGVYVDCAGVVLIHPFLPRLFEALGIAKAETLLEPERALVLLHFLSTGRRSAPEYDLLLPKLLCNVPLDAPVRSRVALTDADAQEASALLTAVIRHWDALGETSIDGLRGSFLVRPGKLSRRGDDHVLQVETRSYDLLLDRLPWGIGTIQLPWMRHILWVEWRF